MPIKVLLNTEALSNGHAVRGVGTYTRLLLKHLKKLDEVEVLKASSSLAATFDPDVIHYPYFDFFAPTLPIASTKTRVVTIHDTIPLIFPEHYPPGMRGSLSFRYQRLALKTVTAVITDSQSSKEDIVKHLGYPKDKIQVVHLAGNPAVTKVKAKKIKQVRQKHSIPKNYILYVGDINYNKNLPQLIKAVKYLPKQLSLVLVGKNFREQDIPEWQWIASQIELSDVDDRVMMLNNVGNTKDLSAVYSGAACYVQPSLYEGFGLPVLEAMQAETPVVCCENSSLTEIGDGHVVFTDCSAEALAEGVKKVQAWTKKERAEVVKKAKTWAKSFSWEKTAQETLAVYQSCL